MNKAHILAEIKRTAIDNGGAPLGRDAFAQATGIKVSDWYGKHWARWGDALGEAGYPPNRLQGAIPEEKLLARVAALVRELGRFPTSGEIRLKKRSDPTFPTHNVFDRFGSRAELARRVGDYCAKVGGWDDVRSLCAARAQIAPAEANSESSTDSEVEFGFVYLLRSGRHCKIGMTNSVGRRERELAIQLPERATLVHAIRTDDPVGIEAYWHSRFSAKRKNGEWFELDAQDIAAFKRRKFM